MSEFEIEETVSFVKLISGEWIIGSLAKVDHDGITLVFPMNEHINDMFLKHTDIQIFKFTHNDYIIVKQANKSSAQRWLTSVEWRYKDDLSIYKEQYTNTVLSSLLPDDGENVVYH